MPFPLLAGLTSFLGSQAGATAIALGQGLGGAIKGVRNRNRQDSQIQRIVADARKAGIHPLAALGSPVSSSYGTPVTGDSVGDAVSSLGSSRSRRLQDKLLEAQISSERAKEIALLSEAQSRTAITAARNGATSGAIPLYVDYVDLDGNIMKGPNPQLPDNEQWMSPAWIHMNDRVVRPPVPPQFPGQPWTDSNVPKETKEQRELRRQAYRRFNRTYAPWER